MIEQESTYKTNIISSYETNNRLETDVVLRFYEQTISTSHTVDIGEVTSVPPMYEGERPPLATREYVVHYPEALIEGYKIACEQYDKQFMNLVNHHKTWESDYQYAPYTFAFQVDGPAYSDEFLRKAQFMNPTSLAEFIVKRAFEFEANIAAYNLNSRLWPDGTTSETWQEALENVRRKTGKEIAVLAGSEEKLDEMLLYEMGITRNQYISPETVHSLTGFDAFLGPKDLLKLYDQYSGDYCPYVLFGRTSKPKSWLKNPRPDGDGRFLANPEILRYVRAHAITHNFDDPTLPINHSDIITDSKEALVAMGAGYHVAQPSDVYSQEFLQYISNNGISIESAIEGTLSPSKKNKFGELFLDFPSYKLLSDRFVEHLQRRNTNSALIARGEKQIRAKPLKQHYGIYGHCTGPVNRARFLNELMAQIKVRGDYVLQPEFDNLHIVNKSNQNETYIAIDRVFVVRTEDGNFSAMESCRSLMPTNSIEGRKNNVHEGSHTRCARIIT